MPTGLNKQNEVRELSESKYGWMMHRTQVKKRRREALEHLQAPDRNID